MCKSISTSLSIVVLSLLCLLVNLNSASAQDEQQKPKVADAKPVNNKPARSKDARQADRKRDLKTVEERFNGLTDERKAELLAFVEEHHPELKQLLMRLQKRKKHRFRNGILMLNKDVTRLQHVQQRGPKRYELALEEWKLKSRVEVMAVKLAIDDSPEKREELRVMIGKWQDVQRQKLQQEANHLEERLVATKKRIADFEANSAAEIERRLKSIERQVKTARNTAQRSKKNAGNKKVPDAATSGGNKKD